MNKKKLIKKIIFIFWQEMEKLKEELIRKDDIVKQCTVDRMTLEKEKNVNETLI